MLGVQRYKHGRFECLKSSKKKKKKKKEKRVEGLVLGGVMGFRFFSHKMGGVGKIGGCF